MVYQPNLKAALRNSGYSGLRISRVVLKLLRGRITTSLELYLGDA